MFHTVSSKLRICAIIYFFGNIIQQFQRTYFPYLNTETGRQIFYNDIPRMFEVIILYFIISLIFYIYARIVRKYEKKIKYFYNSYILSRIFNALAYICFFLYMIRESLHISIDLSYINTGKLMGVESMILMIWAMFIAYLIGCILYGFSIIIKYYENRKYVQ